MRVNRETLLSQLETVQHGLSARNVLEQSASFVFKGGRVYTYNDEVACVSDCEIAEECAVLAKPLLVMLGKLKEETIAVTLTGRGLVIKGKRKSATFRCDEEILLPIDAIEQPGKWAELPPVFGDAVALAVRCTVAAKSAPFIVQCIHIATDGIEAMDNFQMFRYPLKSGLEENVVVLAAAAKHASGLGMSKIAISPNMVHFQNDNGLTMSIRRYCDAFPEIASFLLFKGKKIILPKGLIEAAEKAAVFSGENTEGVISVACTRDKVKIVGTGSSGVYRETTVSKYAGPDLDFVIAPNLLAEIIERGAKCIISKTRIRVSSDVFSYVTCLGSPEKKE